MGSQPYMQDKTSPVQKQDHSISPQTPFRQTVHRDNHSSKSSGSSAGHPRSPESSRPSTSSGGALGDKFAAGRPQSYSSGSTNELQTPISDYGPSNDSSPITGSASPKTSDLHQVSPRVLHRGEMQENVDILPETATAVTRQGPVKQIGKGMSPSPYLPAFEEESDTMKAGEWANIFVKFSGGDISDGGSTLGKDRKHINSLLGETEESSMLGTSTQKIADAEVASTETTASRVSPSSLRAIIPIPTFQYNPDEDDDDDEAATWQVQMQPTKVGVDVSRSTATLEVANLTAETVPLLAMEEAAVSNVCRHDRPSLRVQTDVGAAPSFNALAPAANASHNKLAHQVVAASATSTKHTASPRSARLRSGQGSASASETGQSFHRHATYTQSGTSTPNDSPSQPIMPRESFNTNAWAYRPPVEQLYENLEEFFPGYDLDKPILDVSLSGSTSAIASPALEQAPFASSSAAKQSSDVIPLLNASNGSTNTPGGGGSPSAANVPPPNSFHLGEAPRRFNLNRKSMRMVAQDRKSRLKREETAAKAAAATNAGIKEELNTDKVARRKSTKMWGRKIEEVTSSKAEMIVSAKTDSPIIGTEKERDDCRSCS